MKRKNALITFALFILVACNSEDKKTNNLIAESNEAPKTADSLSKTSPSGTLNVLVERKVKLNKDFSNLDSFKTNLNSFYVSFEAVSGHYSGAHIHCQQSDFNGSKESFSQKFDDRGLRARVELILTETDPAAVEFECLVLDEDVEIDSTTVKLKKSFIISGKENYMSSIGVSNVDTILLDEGAELSTNGNILEVNVNEFISVNGKLVTFSSDKVDTTRINRHGESGGNITLNIKKASGILEIELRGLNGGAMTKVPPARTDRPPRDPSTNGRCSRHNPSSTSNCSGKKGPTGYRGHTGFQGMKGGSSGALTLKVENSKELKLSLLNFPGKGTAGGVGGKGGPGGIGGEGVLVTWREHQTTPMRKKFPNGPVGNTGPEGHEGPRGEDGRIELSRIIFNDLGLDIEINSNWKNFED